MSTKNTTTPEQQSEHEATLDTLRKAYERSAPGFRLAAQSTRAAITANVHYLAKLAGIERGKLTRAELYDAAVRVLLNDGKPKPGAIECVQTLCEEIRKEWERNPIRPEYVKRLKQHWYKTADKLACALGEFYKGWSEYEVTTDEEREEIMREIAALADEAGLDRTELDYEQAYTGALKHLGGTDKNNPHGVRLRELAAEIGERTETAWRAAKAAKDSTAPTPRRNKPGAITITISRDCLQCVGLVRGDEVQAHPADDLKPGDVAAVQKQSEAHFKLGRVVAVGATYITLRDDAGDFTRELAALTWVGRVDHKNPAKGSTLPPEAQERVEELRERLEKLGREDDQIIRCTKRYELEKQIFDIEHPLGEGEDANDWSAWEKE